MMPLQAGLLRKARESVRAAELLADDGLYDIAVSRAYYAMFYVAEAFLAGKGLSFSKHSAVHAAFGQHFARPGILPVHLHRHLLDASAARTLGDYEVGTDLTRDDAERMIAQAKEFIGTAEERMHTTSSDAG